MIRFLNQYKRAKKLLNFSFPYFSFNCINKSNLSPTITQANMLSSTNAADTNKDVCFFFDIDNCLYDANTGIPDLMAAR
jgi:hypothetical protein